MEYFYYIKAVRGNVPRWRMAVFLLRRRQRRGVLKIFISPECIYQVAKQTETNKLTNLTIRAVLTNGHTGHVPRAPGFFFFLRGPQLTKW